MSTYSAGFRGQNRKGLVPPAGLVPTRVGRTEEDIEGDNRLYSDPLADGLGSANKAEVNEPMGGNIKAGLAEARAERLAAGETYGTPAEGEPLGGNAKAGQAQNRQQRPASIEDGAPTTAWKVEQIDEWAEANGVTFEDGATKKQKLAAVAKHQSENAPEDDGKGE